MPPKPVSQSHLTNLLVVGTRVVLRCRLAPSQVEAGGPTLTDVVGDVTEVTAETVVVDTRKGTVPVERSSIVLAKHIPPPPPRRAPRADPNAIGVGELQRLTVAGMPPLESAHVGDWLLRVANGYTGRANSALVIGDPGIPLEAAVERVVDWYAERDQPALVQLPHETGADPGASPVGSLLAQRNWRFFLHTSVMAKATPYDESTAGDTGAESFRVEVSDGPTEDWWQSASPRALEHRDTLGRMLRHVHPAAYLTAYLDDRPVGHLRVALADGWSGVFDVHTDPAVRGRGIARALMHHAERTAAQRRIPAQYLQVALDNDGAVALYRSLGWRVHHEYHYATPSAE